MRVNRPQWGMNNPNRPQQNPQSRQAQQNPQNQPDSLNQSRSPNSTNSTNQHFQSNRMPQNQLRSSTTMPTAPNDTPIMQLTRKIKCEQGEKSAGYFLYAVGPFVAPQEIAHIEQSLGIRSERGPHSERKVSPPPANNMMQMLMSMMMGNKPDPASLMRMMGKMNMSQGSEQQKA